MRMAPQFWTAERRDLIADAEQAYEEGEIDAAELDRRLEFLAELEAEARGICQ